MTRLAVAVLLVALALAGCLGDAGTTDPVGPSTDAPLGLLPDGSPVPLSMTWTRCAAFSGFFAYEMDALRVMLPSGFEPAPYPNDPSGTLGSFVVSTHPCDGVRDLFLGIPVIPPSEHAGDALSHVVALRYLTTNRTVADVFAAWNATGNEHAARVSVGLVENQPLVRSGRVVAESGAFRIDLASSSPGPGGPGEPFQSRVFSVWEDRVVGAVDWTWDSFELICFDRTEATLRVEGAPVAGLPPLLSGTGCHLWGPYDYGLRYVDLGDEARGRS